MALPTPPPSTNPIPNDPFYYPETNYIRGEYGPFIVGSGLNINNNTGVISVTAGGGGVSSVIAGPGISVSGPTGNVTINNAGVRQLAVGPGLSASAATGNVTISFASTPVFPSDFPAKGALLAGTGVGTFSALTVGTDGQTLIACSTEANGVCWGTATAAEATPTVLGTLKGCTFCGIGPSPAAGRYTALGCNAAAARTTGSLNTAIGFNALCSATTASVNVAIGDSALKSMVVSNQNLAIGVNSMCAATSGGQNTAVGINSLMCCAAPGNTNTAIGNSAMQLATGSGSVAIGQSALRLNAGASNVGVGNNAGSIVGTGAGNTFIGTSSGGSIDTGSNNIFIGCGADVGADVSSCLAIGSNPLYWLYGDSTGAIKPAKGIIDSANSCGTNGQVLMSTGANAISWGDLQIASQTTRGVVYGRSGSLLVTDSNVSYGYGALAALAAGSGSNVAVGKNALSAVAGFTTGNTAVGDDAFPSVNGGSDNTALGSGSVGATLVSGSNNVVIGAGADVSSAVVSNEVTISSGAGAQRFSGAGNWAAVSDVRDKTDIQDLALGLDFLKEVKPRRFAWDMRHTDANKGDKTTGFIAQEVQEVVEKFEAADYAKLVETSDENQWMLSQTQFVPILVKAIQELSNKFDALEAKLNGHG